MVKGKDEEWKQVQKQFNRQWREQLQRYYLKSLDSQGMQFKQNDVKFVRWRTLLNEIESLFEERSTTQQISGTQTPGPHLVIKHSDRSILKDANQLIMYAIKKQGSLNKIDKETAKDFLNKWIPKFYKISDDGSRLVRNVLNLFIAKISSVTKILLTKFKRKQFQSNVHWQCSLSILPTSWTTM